MGYVTCNKESGFM